MKEILSFSGAETYFSLILHGIIVALQCGDMGAGFARRNLLLYDGDWDTLLSRSRWFCTRQMVLLYDGKGAGGEGFA
jgi:hypothetical protein